MRFPLRVELYVSSWIIFGILTICMGMEVRMEGIKLYMILIAFFILIIVGILGIYKPIKDTDRMIIKLMKQENLEGQVYNNSKHNPLMCDIEKIIDKKIISMKSEYSEQMLNKQAQIAVLQSQINPHFLYNTLESIRGEALIEGAQDIANMAEALAAFFRYSITQKDNIVTLRDELSNVRNYFLIQEYRFNNKFELVIHIDENEEQILDYYLPKLTIQPIIENAIFHGLETKVGKGHVNLEITMTQQRLLINISDDGIGMSTDTLEEINKAIREGTKGSGDKKGNGIALINVNQRIKIVFGEEYGITVYSTQYKGTDVEIVLPILYDQKTIG